MEENEREGCDGVKQELSFDLDADPAHMQAVLEKAISPESQQAVESILVQVERLSVAEKLLLYLRLPSGRTEPRVPVERCGRSEMQQSSAWVRTHLTPRPAESLPKQHVYREYLAFAARTGMKALSPADFGKAMKQAFPSVRPRRLGVRGHSRYCYAGMGKMAALPTPTLPGLATQEGTDRRCPQKQSSIDLEFVDYSTVGLTIPATISRPPTANSRPASVNSRPPTANSRPASVNSRPSTANSRPNSANSRASAANPRRPTAKRRPGAAKSRPTSAERRGTAPAPGVKLPIPRLRMATAQPAQPAPASAPAMHRQFAPIWPKVLQHRDKAMPPAAFAPRRRNEVSVSSLDKDALDGYLAGGDVSPDLDEELLQYFTPPPPTTPPPALAVPGPSRHRDPPPADKLGQLRRLLERNLDGAAAPAAPPPAVFAPIPRAAPPPRPRPRPRPLPLPLMPPVAAPPPGRYFASAPHSPATLPRGAWPLPAWSGGAEAAGAGQEGAWRSQSVPPRRHASAAPTPVPETFCDFGPPSGELNAFFDILESQGPFGRQVSVDADGFDIKALGLIDQSLIIDQQSFGIGGQSLETDVQSFDINGQAIDTNVQLLDIDGHAMDTNVQILDTNGQLLDINGHSMDIGMDINGPTIINNNQLLNMPGRSLNVRHSLDVEKQSLQFDGQSDLSGQPMDINGQAIDMNVISYELNEQALVSSEQELSLSLSSLGYVRGQEAAGRL